jgi:xylulokinase
MSPKRAHDGEAVLAIDVGLTNCKAVLFDFEGRIASRKAVPYETRRPAPDRVEQDPAAWWNAAVAAVRGLVTHRAARSGRVASIAVTAHMHALACLDAKLRPLGPSLILGDRRAALEADEINRELGEELVYAITGTGMDPSMPAAKIRWLWGHERDLWSDTAWFLGCKDLLRARLTGEVATEPVDACATSLYDVCRGRWSEPIAEAARAPLAALPPIRPPESIAGLLMQEAAAEFGLPAGTPVIVGAGDDVEVMGNGLLDAGASLEHLGTTGSILVVAASATPDPARALELYPHTIDGLWVLGGSMTTAGAALDWAARTLGYRSVKEASGCLRAWPSASNAPVFLPNLEGARSPRREPFVRGAWLGVRPDTSRTDLMLAAFEGVAHGIQAILARSEELLGAGGPITVSAGDSADPAWLQVRADVYGRPLAVLETPEPTALGLLTLATSALGIDPSPAAAVRRIVRIRETIEPRPWESRARRLEIVDTLNRALTGAWPLLAGAV